ncbi:hypothetical protein BDW60DRAFT_212434 [Aspergillus nidulans var. acristatus]
MSAQGPSGGGGPPAGDARPNVSRLRGPRVSLLDEYQAILQSLGIPRYATPAQIFAHDEDNLQRALRVFAGFLEGLQRRPNIPESFRAEVELIRNHVLLRLVEIRAHHLSVAYNIPRVPDFDRDFLGRFELHQIDIIHEYVLNTNTSMRCLPRNMVPDALFYFVNTVLEYCNDVYSGLGSLIPELTHTTYDRGPFKLICDDLTITGVVDIEWVYAGPAQLFGSAPWWLLLDRPANDEWDFEEGEAPKATDRYFRCLEIFIRVLEEEEARMTGNGQRELTELIKWSRDTGAMWLHILLSNGFFDTLTFPCMQLRKHNGEQWWDERIKDHGDTEEVEKFVADKLKDLAAYDVVRDKVDHYKALMDNG